MFLKRTRGYFRASYSLAVRRAAFLFWIPRPLARTWCVLRYREGGACPLLSAARPGCWGVWCCAQTPDSSRGSLHSGPPLVDKVLLRSCQHQVCIRSNILSKLWLLMLLTYTYTDFVDG